MADGFSAENDEIEDPTPPPPVRGRTRLQSGIEKPLVPSDGTVRYDFFFRIKYGSFCSTGEPQSVQEALGDSRWRKAMDEEYLALMKNKTCHLVPANSGDGA